MRPPSNPIQCDSAGTPAPNDAAPLGNLYDCGVRVPEASEQVSIECPLCGPSVGDVRYDIGGFEFRLAGCGACSTGVLTPLPTSEQVASFYPDRYYGTPGRKFAKPIEYGIRLVAGRHVRFLARLVPRGGRILDVGCGRGAALSALADRGFEVHGFEVSQQAVQGIDARVETRIGPDLSSVRYPDDYFDQIIIWHVLEHVPDPNEVLGEVHRILKSGGEVVVAVPNFSSLQARWSGSAWFHLDLPRHLYHFPVQSLRGMLTRRGFVVESEHHFSLRQNPFGWVQSALNKLTRLRRNSLYVLLHSKSEDALNSVSWWQRLLLLTTFVLGMPLGLALELIATAIRSGATVHVVAGKQAAAE